MPTTIRIASFKNINLREQTELSAASLVGAQQLVVESNDGYVAGQVIYVGVLSREGCERAVVLSLAGSTLLNLSAPLLHPHSSYEPVTGVFGDRIRIRRALNFDDKAPLLAAYTTLAHRSIDPDQAHTYYTDSTGGAGYWYLTSYWNETSDEETPLDPTTAFRGDDVGHYATLAEIRNEAGFSKAENLLDTEVDRQRRFAESEINNALSSFYTVPFKQVPAIINTLTIQLAAALLQVFAWGDVAPYSTRLKTARAALASYVDQSAPITDENGQPLTNGEGVTFDFGDQPRSFTIGQQF